MVQMGRGGGVSIPQEMETWRACASGKLPVTLGAKFTRSSLIKRTANANSAWPRNEPQMLCALATADAAG